MRIGTRRSARRRVTRNLLGSALAIVVSVSFLAVASGAVIGVWSSPNDPDRHYLLIVDSEENLVNLQRTLHEWPYVTPILDAEACADGLSPGLGRLRSCSAQDALEQELLANAGNLALALEAGRTVAESQVGPEDEYFLQILDTIARTALDIMQESWEQKVYTDDGWDYTNAEAGYNAARDAVWAFLIGEARLQPAHALTITISAAVMNAQLKPENGWEDDGERYQAEYQSLRAGVENGLLDLEQLCGTGGACAPFE